MDQNFMVTQIEVQSTEKGGQVIEEHIWGTEWAGWIDFVVGEALCTRAFLLLGGGVSRQQRCHREVSIHGVHWPAELRQQNQIWVSRDQLQEAHCKNQGSSKSWMKSVIDYSPRQKQSEMGSLENHHIKDITSNNTNTAVVHTYTHKYCSTQKYTENIAT